MQTTVPSSVAEYVHRVGRTARMDASGQSLLFVLPEEIKFVERLSDHQLVLKELKMEKVLESLVSGQHKSRTGAEEATRCNLSS